MCIVRMTVCREREHFNNYYLFTNVFQKEFIEGSREDLTMLRSHDKWRLIAIIKCETLRRLMEYNLKKEQERPNSTCTVQSCHT